jgi:hypothetical protein
VSVPYVQALGPTDTWAHCASCHAPPPLASGELQAAWFGEDKLTAPAVCVCVNCLRLGLALLGLYVVRSEPTEEIRHG